MVMLGGVAVMFGRLMVMLGGLLMMLGDFRCVHGKFLWSSGRRARAGRGQRRDDDLMIDR
jgi:hypothetical protein